MLTERVLVLETTSGPRAATLPEAMAALCDGSLISFDGLAAHQRHTWDLFLYQTAALALHRAGEENAAGDDAAWAALADPEAWHRRLATLTPGCADTAWSLVADPGKPALLQPPIGDGTLAGYAVAGRTPDEIDVLVTAKGHDVKPARAGTAEPRHWLFALVALQTAQGYSGRGNFGIARMNGGLGSRPLLMLTPRRDMPARFRRGVQVALEARKVALEVHGGYFCDDGLPLLWLRGWDTEESLPLATLDPLFVEICRRIRLARTKDGAIVAWGRPSEVARVAVSKEAHGNLGDAWTPINTKESAALTVGSSGFDYRLVNRLIASEEFKRCIAMQPPATAASEAWLQAAVLVRGQGKTEGMHERWLPIPSTVQRAWADTEQGQVLRRISAGMIADTASAVTALRYALLAYLQGGPDRLDFEDKRPLEWMQALDRRIDRIFFEHLFARVQNHDEAHEAAWLTALVRIVRTLFHDATARLSPPDSRRERARAMASLTLGGMLKKAKLTRPAMTQENENTEEKEEDAA